MIISRHHLRPYQPQMIPALSVSGLQRQQPQPAHAVAQPQSQQPQQQQQQQQQSLVPTPQQVASQASQSRPKPLPIPQFYFPARAAAPSTDYVAQRRAKMLELFGSRGGALSQRDFVAVTKLVQTRVHMDGCVV